VAAKMERQKGDSSCTSSYYWVTLDYKLLFVSVVVLFHYRLVICTQNVAVSYCSEKQLLVLFNCG